MGPLVLLCVSPLPACAEKNDGPAEQEERVAETNGFNYEPLQRLYDQYVNDAGLVDYAGLKAHQAELDAVVKQFSDARR